MPKTLPSAQQHRRQQVPFDIKDWLKQPGHFVTRDELWEFIKRLEAGRKARNKLSRRLMRLARRTWNFLMRDAIEVEDPFYR